MRVWRTVAFAFAVAAGLAPAALLTWYVANGGTVSFMWSNPQDRIVLWIRTCAIVVPPAYVSRAPRLMVVYDSDPAAELPVFIVLARGLSCEERK